MSAILHRNLAASLPVAVRGEGAYLFDAKGKKYLDASGGAAVSCLGHSSPRVIEAVHEQIGRMPFAHTSFFTNEPSEELAEMLIVRAPEGFGRGRVSFVGSGSEAMEVALKFARQIQVERGEAERSTFIARRMSYHGNTVGALSVGGHMQRRALYAEMLMPVTHISPCFAYRFKHDDETPEAYGRRVADELEEAILKIGPKKVAAFVAEPVVGATIGCVAAAPGYFKRIREICDRHGVIFIADEVMCGMGRTGSFFAMEQEGVAPDIITTAKGLGAGYQPIAAMLASEKLIETLKAGSGALANGHTYMSHAVACAASVAVIKTMEEDRLIEAVQDKGAELRAALETRFGQHPHVGDIRGRGLFQALEFVEDRTTKRPFSRKWRIAENLKSKLQDRGLIAYPSSGTADGDEGDHLLLAPPYIVTSDDIAIMVDTIDRTVASVLPA
ncbi:adenosylmethionine-8-amino-7-oxononanoate aminotransferase [Agaricicola taiwanensis]|uniref:Adenosylmethionine-8-amino-7-oxononanoate aminotransferase n=1 Tax=Agaricicola taiwanensis TaxID=591372 RepID=A0A8J2YL90_9RHOB|nr:aspartate aminotransferase family protein [Agaricicola taiwanensis]GGE50406.1 adenosylmethionine-8-amino-7-oxononanoate aminotransferase [Agaricicola taiwanensis]